MPTTTEIKFDANTDELFANEDDLQLKVEWDIVERLFSVKTIDDSPLAEREQQVRKLAMSMFGTYFDAEQRDDVLFGPRWEDEYVVSDWVNKADKLYELSGDFETAKKVLKFLQVVDPVSAKAIVDKL